MVIRSEALLKRVRRHLLSLSGSCVGVQDCWVRIWDQRKKDDNQIQDEDSDIAAAGGFYICVCDK